MRAIEDVLADVALKGRARVDALLEAQSKRDDLGAAELASVAQTTSDRRTAMLAAGHFSRIPGHQKEKWAVSRRLLQVPEIREAASLLVHDWNPSLVQLAIEMMSASPADLGLAHVTHAIAMYFPDQLRAFVGDIILDETKAMLFSGASAEEVAGLVGLYRQSGEVELLARIGFAHTAEAVQALQECESEVPADQREVWEASIENAGVRPDGVRLHTSQSFLGCVGHAGASRHIVGGVTAGPVPKCISCELPAARVLKLRTEDLPSSMATGISPEFYFYACGCNTLENAVVRLTQDGRSVLLGFEHPGPSASAPFRGGEHSLVLAPHPNPRGYGDTVMAGLGRHQIGGAPPWRRLESHPQCPSCRVPMSFLAAIDAGLTSFERFPWKGKLFGFWCDTCSVSWTRCQSP